MQPLGNLSGLLRKIPPGEPGVQLLLSGTTVPGAETLMNSHARCLVVAARALWVPLPWLSWVLSWDAPGGPVEVPQDPAGMCPCLVARVHSDLECLLWAV